MRSRVDVEMDQSRYVIDVVARRPQQCILNYCDEASPSLLICVVFLHVSESLETISSLHDNTFKRSC